MSEIDLSNIIDNGIDPLSELLKSMGRGNIADSASMLASDGKLSKLFDYDLDVNQNKLSIQLNALSVTQFGKTVFPLSMHDEIKNMSNGTKNIPKVTMEFDASALIKLSKLFCIPVANNNDLKEHLHIHTADNRLEYTQNPSEVIDRVKQLSGLKTGSYKEITKDLETKIIILSDNVWDTKPSKDSEQDLGPLGKPGDRYRLENNQLISVKQNIGGPEVAFQHAAQLAMANDGINVGSTKILRMPERSASEFIMIEDSLNDKLLPAAKSGPGGYSGLKRTNESRKLSVNYEQYSPSGDVKHDNDHSLSRLIYDTDSGRANKDILTAAIFNKLLGARNVDGNSVNFNMDIVDNEIVQEIDMGNSFRPEFNTSQESVDAFGKSPEDLTIDDIANSSVNFEQISKLEPQLFQECFERAIGIRADMEKIISIDMISDGTLKIEESIQFKEYMGHSQGAFPKFEKVREPELQGNINVFPVPSDNKEQFAQRLAERNNDASDYDDSAMGNG
jgi:hypothetical protein